jgi:hypothetical protein
MSILITIQIILTILIGITTYLSYKITKKIEINTYLNMMIMAIAIIGIILAL